MLRRSSRAPSQARQFPSAIITQEELHRWLDYEPDTGLFRWKDGIDLGRRNVKPGDIAGSFVVQHGKRRRMLWLNGRRIYASRAAYLYCYGPIPEGSLIDHVDGDPANDKITNLRLASEAQNAWNRIQKEGVPLGMGVTLTQHGRFNARIQRSDGKKLYLGTWDTEAEARAAYMGAAAALHGDHWIGNRAAALEYDDLAERRRA